MQSYPPNEAAHHNEARGVQGAATCNGPGKIFAGSLCNMVKWDDTSRFPCRTWVESLTRHWWQTELGER